MKRLAVLVPLLFLSSCTSYFMQRADDFGDIFRFKLMAGPGISFTGELSRYCTLGGGYYEADAFGFANRSFGIWHETTAEGGIFYGFHREECRDRTYYRGNYGFSASKDGSYPLTEENNPVDIWNIRATVHILIIGADLGIRFGQLADFLTGIVGYDLAGDDYDFGPRREAVTSSSLELDKASRGTPRGKEKPGGPPGQ